MPHPYNPNLNMPRKMGQEEARNRAKPAHSMRGHAMTIEDAKALVLEGVRWMLVGKGYS